jgi:hypothetical protein
MHPFLIVQRMAERILILPSFLKLIEFGRMTSYPFSAFSNILLWVLHVFSDPVLDVLYVLVVNVPLDELKGGHHRPVVIQQM